MKTTLLSKVLIVLLCSVSFITTHAQGLSLSFNLNETDTLSNMIADSKKYDITELTLSGVINIPNADYIIDLNNKGSLRKIDLSNVTALHGATIKRIRVYGQEGEKVLSYYESPVTDMSKIIHDYLGWDGTTSANHAYSAYVEVIDYLKENGFTRQYVVNYGSYGLWKKTKEYCYSEKWPKDVFRDCSFDTFVMPNNIIAIGGADCSFCPQKAELIVIGNNIQKIDNYAFKGAYIRKVEVSPNTRIIGKSAFENTNGDFLSNSFFTNLTSIGYSAFKDSKLVPSKLSLSNIQELGSNAFINTAIEEIEIGDNLTDICDSVFANCINLQKIIGGSNVKSIGNNAFYGCKKLNTFSPSTKLASIGKEAFANTALVNFSIPNATKTIGLKAFANSALRELDLGVYGDYYRDIINGCDSLEVFKVSDHNDNLKAENGVLFSKNGSKIISYPCAKKDAIYELGNNVTEVSDSAFYDVNKLRALVIPESVKTIGKNAFENSSILEVKVLPSTTPKVTDNISGLDQSLVRLFVHEKDYSTYFIANYWGDFKNIFVLENAVSPNNLIHVEEAGTLPEYIGFGNQFKYNSLRLSGKLNGDDILYLREMAGCDVNGKETDGVLTDLDFSQASIVKGGSSYFIKNQYSSGKLTTSDNEIGESMFEDCKFTNLDISENAIKIGDKALCGCPLTTFRLPAATQNISMSAFFGMYNLREFVVDNENCQYQSINDVLFTKDGKKLLLYPYAKEGERYNIPETVTTIEEQAFGGSHLKIIITNKELKNIETLAFSHLSSLETISLPSTLERIGHRAFWGCNKLMELLCKAYYPPTLEYDSYSYSGQPYNNFSDKTYENAVLLVPQKNGGYKSRAGWKLFNNVIESDDWTSGFQTTNDTNNTEIERCFDLNGRVVMSTSRGIIIIKMSNGTSKKVYVK